MSASNVIVAPSDGLSTDADLCAACGVSNAVVLRRPSEDLQMEWPDTADQLDFVAFTSPVVAGELGQVLKLLKPRGEVQLRAFSDANSARMSLLVNGFEKVEALDTVVRANKPDWSLGAKASISIPQNGARDAKSLGVLTWSVDADDDLVDEDELLDDSALPAAAEPADCGSGKSSGRRPCKGCTCGRADEAKAVVLDPEAPEAPSSACGNCHKGDAFRCASCPYLGKPAFEKGAGGSITISLADDI